MTEAPEQIHTPPPPVPVAASGLLRGKIVALRRRHLAVATLTGVAMTILVSIELLALAMFLDWWLDLPWGVRLLSLIAQLGVFTYILLRFVVAPLLRQPDEDQLALMVEKAQPGFRSRLIAAVQLVRAGAVPPGASMSLVGALVEETETFARPSDFRQIVSTDRLKKFGLIALFVSLIALLGFSYGRDTCPDLLKRVFLSTVPVPRKTRVIVPEGDKTIGRGDNVRLEAWVRGIIPADGKVEVKYRNRRGQEFSLEQDRDDRTHFGRTIENVQDTFTYRIHLNDGSSETYEVKTIPRPTVATVECDQEFPAYTKLKPMRRSLGDLSLLAGSRLKIKVTATKDIQSAAIKLVGPDQELPMQLHSQKARELTGEFVVPAKGMNGFSIQMLDTEGMESKDSAVYRVEIIPDKVPVVRITYPERKEELITRQATMIVGLEAGDDFAISKMRLRYKVDTVDDGAEKVVPLDLEGQTPERVRRRHEWKIGEFSPPLSEGSSIEYWIEAEDNNDATGPGLGASEHQLAKVVSEAEKRADLLNRAGDYLGNISDVATDQEKLNRNLGAIINPLRER